MMRDEQFHIQPQFGRLNIEDSNSGAILGETTEKMLKT